jgi:glycosyltransferase involved in cell wall biosynthesis
MKILHIHFGKDGGAERFFVKLVNGLNRRGVEQEFFIRPDRLWRKEIEPCGRVHEGVHRRLSLSRFALQWRIRQVLKRLKPDAIMAWAPRACQAVPSNPGSLRVGRLGDYPLRLRYFSNIDVLVGNTPDIEKRILDLGWTRRTATVTNFSDVTAADPVDRTSLGVPRDAFLVVGMGRFVHRKGFDVLIEATAKLPGAHLWLIGDGEERANLEAIAAKAGLTERLKFLGWQDKPADFVAASDVLVMPSRHEPLGNVVLEGWSIGTPVISAKSEGPLWMMTDGVDGLLTEIGDVDGLAAALTRLRDDRQFAARLVDGGRATLDARFSETAVVDAYLELFASAQSRS